MTCSRCGKNNLPNSQYCANCRTKLSLQGQSNNKRNIGGMMATIVVLAVLLGVAVGVIIYMIINSPEDAPPTNNQTLLETPSTSANQTPVTNEDSYIQPIQPTQVTQSKQSGHLSTSNERQTKKETFLEEAYEIEKYSDTCYATAQSQYELNYESDVVFEKWDVLLNEVYQYLKTIMPVSDFKQLEKDELDWIVEKESAIEETATQWKGGTGETLARNSTAIGYTVDRCYYLISLIDKY